MWRVFEVGASMKELKEELKEIQKRFDEENKKLLEEFEEDMRQFKMPENLDPQFSSLPQQFVEAAKKISGSLNFFENLDGNNIGKMIDELKDQGALTPEMEDLIVKLLEEVKK